MSDVLIAPSEADARAAEAVQAHHAAMSGALAARTEALLAAAARRHPDAVRRARLELVAWCGRELVPHALAEEEALYPAAHGTSEGRLLVEAMLGEHRLIAELVGTLTGSEHDAVRAASTAIALRTVFESHLAKENDLIIPLLLRTPGVSVAGLLDGMHEVLGEEPRDEHEAEHEGGGCGSGHACACGQTDPAGHPELDARAIPHAIRHATIFGALETVRPGAGLVLIAPHDPRPLLGQVDDRWPGGFDVDYLERGPESWRLVFVRAQA